MSGFSTSLTPLLKAYWTRWRKHTSAASMYLKLHWPKT